MRHEARSSCYSRRGLARPAILLAAFCFISLLFIVAAAPRGAPALASAKPAAGGSTVAARTPPAPKRLPSTGRRLLLGGVGVELGPAASQEELRLPLAPQQGMARPFIGWHEAAGRRPLERELWSKAAKAQEKDNARRAEEEQQAHVCLVCC